MQTKEEQQLNAHDPVSETAFVICLFVTGASPDSARAVSNLKELCGTHMHGKYSLEVIDVYQQQTMAGEEQIVALPLLIKKFPFPERRITGDLSNTDKILRGLGLKPY